MHNGENHSTSNLSRPTHVNRAPHSSARVPSLRRYATPGLSGSASEPSAEALGFDITVPAGTGVTDSLDRQLGETVVTGKGDEV